jgi:hypothetical protein
VSAERFEYKYHLPPTSHRRLLAALRPWVHRDAYSEKGEEGRYFVRSLYYDTADYRAYTEKLHGERNRIKLRVRTYHTARDDAATVSVELKTRSGSLVRKFATHTPWPCWCAFARTGSWRSDVPELVEFERRVRLAHQRPVVLVDYWREAFVPKDRSEVRITVDHDLRAAAATELYPERARFRVVGPRCPILEIKTAGDAPDWLDRIVKDFGLKSQPNSKYAQAAEATQNGLVVRS